MFRTILAAFAALFVTVVAFSAPEPHATSASSVLFEDFPAQVAGVEQIASPRIRGAFPERFSTRIREAADTLAPNFAGHYILTQWGCGTECQSGAIVDATTGTVHQLPTSEWGVEFRADSRLLIVNPSVDGTSYVPEWLTTRYYLWDGNEFRLIKEAKPVPEL